MQPEIEFVIRVRKWPAYILAAFVPVLIVLYCLMVGLMVWTGALSHPVSLVLASITAAAAGVSVALMVKATLQAFAMIRYPPRISTQGLRLWLFPTSEYVLLPWERVTAVCTFVKGFARGFFVYVDDAAALANGKSSQRKKIIRMMRRFNGAPFVYAINASPARLHEIDGAVRHFSGGRLMLGNR